MLGVENHLRPASTRKRTLSRIIARFSSSAHAQDLGDLEVRRLADDRDTHRRVRATHACPGRSRPTPPADASCRKHRAWRAAGSAERPSGNTPRPSRSRPDTRLRCSRCQTVESLGDQELVLKREADPFALRSVAKRRVVESESTASRVHLPTSNSSTPGPARSFNEKTLKPAGGPQGRVISCLVSPFRPERCLP